MEKFRMRAEKNPFRPRALSWLETSSADAFLVAEKVGGGGRRYFRARDAVASLDGGRDGREGLNVRGGEEEGGCRRRRQQGQVHFHIPFLCINFCVSMVLW